MADTTDSQGGAEAAGHGADAGAHGAEASGMPQLDFSTFPNQIFWAIIALVAIYFILTRMALPKIVGTLADRQDAITNDIAAAEDLKLKAREAEEAYEKALAEARAEAGRIAGETRAKMQEDLNLALEAADRQIAEKTAESEARIGEIRDSALQSVEVVAKDTAGALVAALGGQADDAAVAAAVDAQLKG